MGGPSRPETGVERSRSGKFQTVLEIIPIDFHSPRRGKCALVGSLENTIAIEYGPQRIPTKEVTTGMIFFGYFFVGEGECLILQCPRDNNHAIEIGEDEFARAHEHAPAVDRYIISHHSAAAHTVERPDAR